MEDVQVKSSCCYTFIYVKTACQVPTAQAVFTYTLVCTPFIEVVLGVLVSNSHKQTQLYQNVSDKLNHYLL